MVSVRRKSGTISGGMSGFRFQKIPPSLKPIPKCLSFFGELRRSWWVTVQTPFPDLSREVMYRYNLRSFVQPISTRIGISTTRRPKRL